MICKSCRNQVPDGMNRCPNCGGQIMVERTQQVNQVQPVMQNNYNQNNNLSNMNSAQQPRKKSNSSLIIILIIAIIIGIFVLKPKGGNNSNSNSNSNSTSNSNVEINSNSNVESNSNSNTTTINTNYDKDGAFLMPIDDVFTITGKGTVVTGKISRGTIKVNDEIEIIGLNHEVKTTIVTAISKSRQQVESAQIGESVGLTLKDVSREEIEEGQVVVKPNSIKETKSIEANVYFLTEGEGGRKTPIMSNYKPQVYIYNVSSVTGTVTLLNGKDSANPGDKVDISIELEKSVALEVGKEFTIREGGITVGKGTVTKVN